MAETREWPSIMKKLALRQMNQIQDFIVFCVLTGKSDKDKVIVVTEKTGSLTS